MDGKQLLLDEGLEVLEDEEYMEILENFLTDFVNNIKNGNRIFYYIQKENDEKFRFLTSICLDPIITNESIAVFDSLIIKLKINKIGNFPDTDLIDIAIDEIIRKIDRNIDINEKMLRYLIIGLYSIKDEVVKKLKYL